MPTTNLLNTIIGKIQTVLEQYMQLERECVQLANERDQYKQALLNEQQNLNNIKKKFDLLYLSINVHLLENAEEDGSHSGLSKQIDDFNQLLHNTQP